MQRAAVERSLRSWGIADILMPVWWIVKGGAGRRGTHLTTNAYPDLIEPSSKAR
jgi:hypothetical protein